jgi:ribosome-binding protein aMBF1 (putative translation factor)
MELQMALTYKPDSIMKFNVDKLKQSSREMTVEEKSDISFREDNREWLALSEKLALRIRHLLRTKNILQTELAERMNVSPAQVTKILSGKENLGLKTISKIERAIGSPIIDIPAEIVEHTVCV